VQKKALFPLSRGFLNAGYPLYTDPLILQPTPNTPTLAQVKSNPYAQSPHTISSAPEHPHLPQALDHHPFIFHADMRANTPDMSGHWPNKKRLQRIEREREREGSEKYVSK
jgi:hypothetical protein